MSFNKRLGLVFILTASILSLAVWADGREIVLMSHESRTVDGGPVFNRIRWFTFGDKDVWMMNQSHHGPAAPAENWERLAIVIDKTTTPPTAKYYQLEPGPLEWKESILERPYRVSCFTCHANGPRAIRPNPNSKTPLFDRLKIAAWNTRIKLYGRVTLHPDHEAKDKNQKIPVRWPGEYANEKLQIATCANCHKEEGLMARGPLLRQHAQTIRFMTDTGHMPPLGLSLSTEEIQSLQKFLNGF